ncbi:MAG TPA: glycosyltransferase family protein [Cytophagales bacterium]|nr:glycosyltransferase family protein [Cytophagales bacterium]
MLKKKLRYLFIVQGEGRGHMMQAIALQELILRSGHEIVGVLIGNSPRREIPHFFYERINAPISVFESPNFILDKRNQSIKVLPSIILNLKKNKTFLRSLSEIDQKVKEYKPDVIINFYELLCGLYFKFYKPAVKNITLSHHYLLVHPEFPVPKGKIRDKYFMKLNNRITSFGADKVLALSFRELAANRIKNTFVVPPLLRREIKLSSPEKGDFVLSYILNEGYSEEILNWHKNNKHITLHCFWDKKDVDASYSPHENLFFHKLDDKKFLDLLKSCKAYVSTAGFESIGEAMYLGKPVMMVPTGGHFEQACNALDAVKAGAGVSVSSFDIQILLDFLPEFIPVKDIFHKWVDKADELFLQHLEE